MYAFDELKGTYRPTGRQWTVVGQTEEESMREMAPCLREIGAGGRPSSGLQLVDSAEASGSIMT